MKKLQTALFITVLSLGVVFTGSSTAIANTPAPAIQVVPKTKSVSKKVYSKGRYVTVVTYKGGKRITKKVWRKGSGITKKSYSKTKNFIMGPSKKTP